MPLPPASQYVLCLEKKYAAEAQLITFTTKNASFSLNDNHSCNSTVSKSSLSKYLEMAVLLTKAIIKVITV